MQISRAGRVQGLTKRDSSQWTPARCGAPNSFSSCSDPCNTSKQMNLTTNADTIFPYPAKIINWPISIKIKRKSRLNHAGTIQHSQHAHKALIFFYSKALDSLSLAWENLEKIISIMKFWKEKKKKFSEPRAWRPTSSQEARSPATDCLFLI